MNLAKKKRINLSVRGEHVLERGRWTIRAIAISVSLVGVAGVGGAFAAAPVAAAPVGGAANVAKAAPAVPAAPVAPPMPSGDDIVRACDNKLPGLDQQSQLSITLKEQSGTAKKTVYLRLWKDMKGADDIIDKMVLFTVFPPDAKGSGFMRWAYTAASAHNAEQWVYLPVLKSTRRVSMRDLGDSFLGSDLTYGDITYRTVEEDAHELVRIDRDDKGNDFYVVQSVPKDKEPQYSRKLSWYSKTAVPEECVKVRVDFYDRKNAFLKRQMLNWQRVGTAWVWDKVFVQNGQTFHTSYFEVSKVKINVGLKDDWFTQRRLEQGLN